MYVDISLPQAIEGTRQVIGFIAVSLEVTLEAARTLIKEQLDKAPAKYRYVVYACRCPLPPVS